MLADHVAAGQALGGDSSFAGIIPAEAGGAGWSPWAILGGIVALGDLSALAIAARNHDRHHNKHHDDQPQPQPNPNPQPNPQTIAPPTVAKDPTHKGGVTITPDNKATTLEIKYTDEAGQPHTIHVNKGTNGKWQADGSLPPGVVVDPNTGKVTLAPDSVKDGSSVTAKNSDGSHSSMESTVIADNDDATPPPNPNPNPGPNPQPQPGGINPPTVAKDPAHKGGVVITPDSKATTLDVNYTDEQGQSHSVSFTKDASGKWVAKDPLPKDVTVDAATGKVTIAPEAVKDGSTVKAHNSDGTHTSPDADVITDTDGTTPPPATIELPQVVKDPAHQGGVIVTPNGKAKTLTVTYTDESNQPHTLTVEKDVSGKWTPKSPLPTGVKVDDATDKVTFEPDAVKDGSTVTAKNSDGSITSNDSSLRAPDDAVTPPPANVDPTANADTAKGTKGQPVEIDVLANDSDPQGNNTLDPKSVKLIDPATNQPVSELKVAGEGEWKVDPTTGKVTFTPDPAFKGNPKPVQYVVSDIDKHESQPGTITVTYDNVTPPQPQKIDPPTVAADPDHQGGMTVTPVDKATTLTVNYTDEKEQPQKITVVKDPQTGEWKPEGKLPSDDIKVDPATGKVTLPPDEVKDGSTVVAKNGDGTLTSDEKSGIAPNDDGNTPSEVEVASITGDKAVEGMDLTYDVTLDKPADKDITVTLKHSETSDADFSPAPEINKTLTIPAGKTEVEFKLNTVDDKQAEGKETYSLTLSEPKGAQLGDHTSVTTAINDATTPPPAIPQVKSVSSPQAEEGKALVYEVALDAPQADTPVELTLKNGTATLGTDTGSPIEVSTDGGTTWTPVTPGSDGKFTATVPAGSENGVKVRVAIVTDF